MSDLFFYFSHEVLNLPYLLTNRLFSLIVIYGNTEAGHILGRRISLSLYWQIKTIDSCTADMDCCAL